MSQEVNGFCFITYVADFYKNIAQICQKFINIINFVVKKKSVSSTYLTHNTNAVIGMLKDSGGQVYINNYNKPVAVLVEITKWQELQQQNASPVKKLPTLKELERYTFSSTKPVDSAKIIRKWRDNDG